MYNSASWVSVTFLEATGKLSHHVEQHPWGIANDKMFEWKANHGTTHCAAH